MISMTGLTLPRIVRITGSYDAGEFGGTTCPHCGADCRYYKTFDALADDGSILRLGAAAGCIRLFPQSKLVEIHAYVLDKQRKYEAQGWQLGKSDAEILDLIDETASGKLTESYALERIAGIRRAMAEWRKNKSRR